MVKCQTRCIRIEVYFRIRSTSTATTATATATPVASDILIAGLVSTLPDTFNS